MSTPLGPAPAQPPVFTHSVPHTAVANGDSSEDETKGDADKTQSQYRPKFAFQPVTSVRLRLQSRDAPAPGSNPPPEVDFRGLPRYQSTGSSDGYEGLEDEPPNNDSRSRSNSDNTQTNQQTDADLP